MRTATNLGRGNKPHHDDEQKNNILLLKYGQNYRDVFFKVIHLWLVAP